MKPPPFPSVLAPGVLRFDVHRLLAPLCSSLAYPPERSLSPSPSVSPMAFTFRRYSSPCPSLFASVLPARAFIVSFPFRNRPWRFTFRRSSSPCPSLFVPGLPARAFFVSFPFRFASGVYASTLFVSLPLSVRPWLIRQGVLRLLSLPYSPPAFTLRR